MTTKISIVHCVTSTGNGGGIPRMDGLLYRHIDRERFDIKIVALKKKDESELAFDDEIPYIFTGVENRFEKLLPLFATADIVTFAGGFEPLVCETARLANVPVLVEIMHLPERGQLFDYISATVAVSESVAKLQPDRSKVSVIHNGIDTTKFRFSDRHKFLPKKIIIESGRREKATYFHLDEIAEEISAKNENVEFWLAGRGQDGESTDSIKYLGLRTDIEDLYQQADIAFLFSKKEAFGLTIAEAMACGAVPVCSGVGGMSEIVTDGEDGFIVDGNDRQKVVETIKNLLGKIGTKDFEHLRRQGRKKIEQKFSVSVCVKKYEKLFMDLLDKQGVRSASYTGNITPSPEAIVGELAHDFNADRTDLIEKRSKELALHNETISNRICAGVIENIARHMSLRKHNETARNLYRTLYKAGFRDLDFIKAFFEISEGEESLKLLGELIAKKEVDDNLLMAKAEQVIEQGDLPGALGILQIGIAVFPDCDDIKIAAQMLADKLQK